MRNRLLWPWPLFRGRLRSCQSLRDICHWISQKLLEIDAWFQRTTNTKWLMGNRIVTRPMTSRVPERSRSWHTYTCILTYFYLLTITIVIVSVPIFTLWGIKNCTLLVIEFWVLALVVWTGVWHVYWISCCNKILGQQMWHFYTVLLQIHSGNCLQKNWNTRPHLD